jgi:hypothetical protein
MVFSIHPVSDAGAVMVKDRYQCIMNALIKLRNPSPPVGL